MSVRSFPKHLKEIKTEVINKLKFVRKPSSELLDQQQVYHDKVLKIYQEAFHKLINKMLTYSNILSEIKEAYENSLSIRNSRISQFIVQDKVFGLSVKKSQRDEKLHSLLKENGDLKEQIMKLELDVSKLKKDLGKLKDEQFTDYLSFMRERDGRYTLYFENVALQMKLKELDGSFPPVDTTHGDPVVLRIALDRCREQLSATQCELKKMTDEYSDTVPRREYDTMLSQYCAENKLTESLKADLAALQDSHKRILSLKKTLEEEHLETKERCQELERAGTPRPQWEICADFIGGGRDRWRQLASGLSSRDILRVLLKELGPAAENEQLEYFDGLGLDPSIPPYLRYEGRVRNLRLSRRELSVVINDIWLGKAAQRAVPMQDFVTKYFEDRYQQPSVRAEWAYNVCAGAEQALDEPQVRLFWGVLHRHLSEDIYWGLRDHWARLQEQLYRIGKETITIEEFEKTARTVFPLKNEVDIKNLSDVVRKQLKLKLNNNEVNLDKLFQENEEGFERLDLAREVFRQRQAAQDRYLREVLAALQAPARPASVQALKRAFALVDPAIDHVRMERNIRWAFSTQHPEEAPPLPPRVLAARLAAGDIERVGPRTRSRAPRRAHYK